MSAEKLPRSTPAPDRDGADLRRAPLTATGLSRDGERLLLVNEDGVEFAIEVDARLRETLGATVRPERTRPAPSSSSKESTMDDTTSPALRPRDIQARIRAGESPEAVAEVARISLDRVMNYAVPVIAERQHVAERAQKASVRRRAGEPGGAARTLGEAVGGHLRGRNVDPAVVTWDAWRREDGRWVVTGEFATPERTGSAHLVFDSPGNFVTMEDDDARWLLGDLADDPIEAVEALTATPPPGDDLERARRRRQTVPEADPAQDELPLGDDAIELVSEPAFEATPEPMADTPTESPAHVVDAAGGDEPSRPARPLRKKGRATIPSWDEIMFGGSPGSPGSPDARNERPANDGG